MGKKSRAKREKRAGGHWVKMSPEMKTVLEQQLQSFREKFGREPGPEDPLFFDPTADTPQPFSEKAMDKMAQDIYTAMGDAGIDPALIYAAQKTGRLAPPSKEVYDAMSLEEQAEWDGAVNEYEVLAASAGTRWQ